MGKWPIRRLWRRRGLLRIGRCHLEFLDLAKPFMTEEDVSRFLQLSGHDKDAFIRDFWKRHS